MLRSVCMHKLALPAALGLLAAACAEPTSPPADEIEDGFLVDDAKEDNFLSTSAREFVLTGRSRVTLTENATDREVQQMVSAKQIAIAWFLNQYLVDKEKTDANFRFGGFGAMVKAGAHEELGITKINGNTWEFQFTQIIAGKTNLMQRLPLQDGVLSLEVGKPTNEELVKLETNAEWYREAPWSAWDPSMVPESRKETIAFTMREEKKPVDAWWDYQRLFADGKLDIDVYFGWDYHGAFHLKHSRELYHWLKDRGFRSPVGDFDRLTRKSAPLTKTIRANGKNVRVEVRILYGKAGTDMDPDTDAGGKVLEEEMLASVATRDVIVYSGHSGPFYGFALANWKKTNEGDFDDADMMVAPMADKYQVVLAEGCDTYMIGQAFLDNPAKMGADIDVITTTSFSDAESPATVHTFLARLLELDSQGRHRPRTLKSLMQELDEGGFGTSTMYGVHGIDDDPRLHPYAEAGNLCKSCSANSDCGDVGNSCITVGDSGRRCAAACTDDSGCPSGYTCRKVASASTSTIYGSMCVPVEGDCP